MIKVLILVLFMSIWGCVSKKMVDSNHIPTHKEQKTSLLKIFQIDSKDEISDFTGRMPKSGFIRRGVVHFYKSTPEKVIDVEVLDFDLDSNTLVILKKDLIILSHLSCNSMLNNHSLSNIYLNGKNIYGESQESVVIYDIPNCGIVSKISKNNYSFRPGADRFVLFQNRNFKVLNIDRSEHLSGNLFKKIKDAHMADNYLFLLDIDNNFVTVDIPNKVMLPSQKIDADEVHFGKEHLFIKKDGKISMHNYKEINKEAQSYDAQKCYLKGYNSFCTDQEIISNSDKVLNYDNYLLVKSKNTLISLKPNEKIYKKTISLTEYSPKTCRENNHIVFYDIDKTVKKINLSTYSVEIVSGNFKCENPLSYRLGKFYHKDTPILKIGEIVNSDEKDVMIMRQIDEDNFYIFFETASNSL